MIAFIADPEEKARVASLILGDLPEWFGIPVSTAGFGLWSVLRRFGTSKTRVRCISVASDERK